MNLELIPSDKHQEREVTLDDIRSLIKSSSNPTFVEECRSFVSNYAEGDNLIEFCSNKKDWRSGMGLAGFSLRRNNTEVNRLIVKMS